MAGVSKPKEDLTGKTFNDWTVIKYVGKGKWMCQCSCGTIREIQGTHLKIGRTKNCGHNATNKKIDLTGMDFDEWHVLSQASPGLHGETRWLCRCSCGIQKIVTSYALRNHTSKSCGHSTTGLHDITGQTFNEWKVLRRSETKVAGGSTKWICQCSCGTIAEVGYYELKNGISKSCGCKSNELRIKTTLEKYGVSHVSQIGTLRTQEQLNAISSKEDLSKFIKDNFDHKPSAAEVAEKLGISRGTLRDHLLRKNLMDLITTGNNDISGFEIAIRSMYPCDHLNDRTVLNGKEIDLYYPHLKFGIEFNGNYWHSEYKKEDIKYHQNKTLDARSKGIRLFHIFEYEWMDKQKRVIIKDMLSSIYYNDRVVRVPARSCIIKEVASKEAEDFFNRTHIQGAVKAKVNVGLYRDDKLLCLMSFGKPRFNSNYNWELLRLSTELSTVVIGGASKIFKYFIDKYNPDNILSYCDLSKFTGNIYSLLGFELDGITNPGYVWINLQTYDVMTRYQTEKRKLVELGLGCDYETESDIMHRLGYVKIYDCGNLRFSWINENKTERQEV